MARNAAIASDQRSRIVEGATVAIAEGGFGQVAVKQVIAHAGVSRRTFYDFFGDMDDVLCTAHREALDDLARRVSPACDEGDWADVLAGGILRAIEWATDRPQHAQLVAGGPFVVGPRAAYCQDLLAARFGAQLRLGRRYSEGEVSAIQEEALLAGIAGIVASRLADRDACGLAALGPQLVELALGFYLGPVEARRVARRWSAICDAGVRLSPADQAATRVRSRIAISSGPSSRS